MSVDPRLLTRSAESREAEPIIEVEDPFYKVKDGGGEIEDGSLFTEKSSFSRLSQGDDYDLGQVEMMDQFTKYDDDMSGAFYSIGNRHVSTTSTQQETTITSVSPQSVFLTRPQIWSPYQTTPSYPTFLPSPPTSISPSPLSTRHITTSSSQTNSFLATNDNSHSPPNTSNDYYDREDSLSPVPIGFEERTPIIKVLDSITVTSTPSTLPSTITGTTTTPRQVLNRTRIIDIAQPRLGRPAGRKIKRKKDIQPRRSSRLHYENQSPEEQHKFAVGPLTEDEFNRVYEMKNGSTYYTWRDIGRELNRDWRDVRTTWRKTRQWDESKVLSLRLMWLIIDLSIEGVIGGI